MKLKHHFNFAALGLLCVMGTAMYTNASAQTEAPKPEVPKITVNATGEVRVKPDAAEISVGVENIGATALSAAAENARQSNDVQEAAKLAGITPDDIQTLNYSVNPIYSYPPAGSSAPIKITGYKVSNTIRITEPNIAMLSTVLDGVTKAGSNTINSIEFTIRNSAKVEDKALRIAVLRARAKAKIIATAAGMKLGNPISINLGQIYHPVPMGMMLMERSAKLSEAAPPISGGKQTISVSVTAVFSMLPAVQSAKIPSGT